MFNLIVSGMLLHFTLYAIFIVSQNDASLTRQPLAAILAQGATVSKKRDDFDSKVTDALSRRASFICSNPDCRALTIAPSKEDTSKSIYVGVAAHITGASPGGSRYDPKVTPEQRSSIDNAIFLCSTCSVMIDKNNGADFPADTLRSWKRTHEAWVREHLNKSVSSIITVVDGEHHAKGVGTVTGLEIKKPAILKPGTKVTAEGVGNITGTKIGE